MSPDDDEPEEAPEAPQRQPEGEADATADNEASEGREDAFAPYAAMQNMYAMGLPEEASGPAHADAEVAEGAPENGEYVDAEQEQAALADEGEEAPFGEAPPGDEAEGGEEDRQDHEDDGHSEGEDEVEGDSAEGETALEGADEGYDEESPEADTGQEEDEAGHGAAVEDARFEEFSGDAEQEPDYGAPPEEEYAAPPLEEPEPSAFAQYEPEPDASEELYEPPFTPPPPRAPPPPPAQQRRMRAPVQEDDGDLFGQPEVPMPPSRRRIDKMRARDARTNLDLDLGRIKRIKRYGLFLTTLTVVFVALVLAPVTWVGAYGLFDPPSNVLMMKRAAEGQTIRHYPVPINRMSPHIVRAVIAAEDANFCTHDGFDVEAIQNAMQANARSTRTRGASTISQQTAKNLFLWPDRSWLRKGLETYFTALIEFMWPKRRIMEAYLNTAEWGDGNFGVEAAARARFGVSAADLTPLQAARLAAVLPNPNRWRADHPGPYVRQRSAMLVGRARVVRDERMAACVLNLDRPSQ